VYILRVMLSDCSPIKYPHVTITVIKMQNPLSTLAAPARALHLYYHKLSRLKGHSLLISVFRGQDSEHGLDALLRSPKAWLLT
jgi:hypothetical protein